MFMSLKKVKTPLLITFGKRIRELRTLQGYSQEKFADKVGLHRTYMGSVERGEQNLSLVNIKKIAKALNLKLSELLKEVD